MQILKQCSVTRKDIFLLGFITIVGGQVYGWNVAYHRGIQESGVIFSILSLGYFSLCFCLAEMASALPFSGGIYGLVRAFVHPLLGSLIATFELLMNVFFIAPFVHVLASLPIDAELVDQKYLLLLCFGIYFVMTCLNIFGGKVFWNATTLIGVTIIIFVLIYQFGSLPGAKLNTHHAKHLFRFHAFVHSIPDMSSIFLGIQFLPLTSKFVQNPKTDIPYIMLVLMSCCVITALGFMLLTASHDTNLTLLSADLYPLHYGFSRILSISMSRAKLMNIPFLVGTICGFTFFCGRQMAMMAKSGLLPSTLAMKTPGFDTPYVALITISICSFVLNIVGHYDSQFMLECFRVSSLASFLVFISAMIAYILFQLQYSSLERTFYSPLQRYGAYLGILVFIFCFVGGAMDHTFSLVVVLTASGIALIYSFVSGKVTFSEEEQQEMFKAYLMNGKSGTIILRFAQIVSSFHYLIANRAAKKRMRKGHSVNPHATTVRKSPHHPVENSRSHPLPSSPAKHHSEYSEESENSRLERQKDETSTIDLETGHASPQPVMVMTRQLLATNTVVPIDALNTPTEESKGQTTDRTLHQQQPLVISQSVTRDTATTAVTTSSSKKLGASIREFLSAKFNQVRPESEVPV